MAFFVGDLEAAREISAALAAESRCRGTAAWLPGALQGLTLAQIMTGEWPMARASAVEGLKLAHDMAHVSRAAFLAALLGLLAAYAGDDDGCRAWTTESLRLGGRTSFNLDGQSTSLALLDLGNGRFGAALDRLANPRGSWWDDNCFMRLPDVVEAAARVGDAARAREAAGRFEAWLNLTDQPWARAVAHRCRALVSDDAHARAAHPARTAGRTARRGRPVQPRHRRPDVPVPPDRRLPPVQGPPQARRHFPGSACRPAHHGRGQSADSSTLIRPVKLVAKCGMLALVKF